MSPPFLLLVAGKALPCNRDWHGECGPKFGLRSGIEPDVAGASNQLVAVVFELPCTIVERDPFLTLTVIALQPGEDFPLPHFHHMWR